MQVEDKIDAEFIKDIALVLGQDNLNKFAGKRILLTGGSGFLGSLYKQFFLCCNNHKLIYPACKVISVDNYIKGTVTSNDETKDNNLISINHDLTTSLGLKLDNEPIDFIIGCAGNASPRAYQTFPLETMDISSIGARHLLELAYNKRSKILHFSSSEVLGTPDARFIPTDENYTPTVKTLDSRSPYDVGKMYIETLCWTFKTKYQVDCKVVRPFNVTGRFHKNDYRVIPNYLVKLLKNEKIEVYKPGTQTRTFCYYTDFITGSLLVLLNGEDLLYHIGNPNNEISMFDLAVKMQNIAGKSDLVSLVETPEVYLHEPKRRCPSIEKAKKELGFNPQINLEEMLKRIYNWAEISYIL